MIYLITVLAPWLLLTAAFAGLAGWAVAAERGTPAQVAQRRERDKLVRDLAQLAAGQATPQTAIVMRCNNNNGAALYSITKAAIHRMTEVLAVEWARFNINVNCIAPGAFASEMMDGMLSRMGDITKYFPRGRLGDPAQLDSTLLYLVSPASEAVTGTTIKVDDGQGSR